MDKLLIDPKEIIHPLIPPQELYVKQMVKQEIDSVDQPRTIFERFGFLMNLSPFLSYIFIIGFILFMIYAMTTQKDKNIKKPSYLDKSTNQTKEFLKTMTEKIKRRKEEIIQWFQGFFYKMRVKNKTFSTYRKKRKT